MQCRRPGSGFRGRRAGAGFQQPEGLRLRQAIAHHEAPGARGQTLREQNLGGKEIDTAKYKKPGPYNVCFSNAGVGNPWRVVGWLDMQAQVDMLKSDIKSFTAADAEGKDDKQISDINSFVSSWKCDVLIVSPNTTAALTPAVKRRRSSVVVFDRGVQIDCPVTFVNPIGGYGWGISTASFIVDKLPKAARCWACESWLASMCSRPAGRRRTDLQGQNISVVGAEFTGGDNAKTKTIVEDYINRFGKIDAIWMMLARPRGCHRGLRRRRPAVVDHHRRPRRTSWPSGRATSSPPCPRPIQPTNGARRLSRPSRS